MSTKAVAIIQARIESSRLPGKVLLPIAGKPILQHVVERVRTASLVDEVVVAAGGDGYQTIKELCWHIGVAMCHATWHVDDVLKRFAAAATAHSADLIVRICGDSPLIDPEAIDVLLDRAKSQVKADYYGYELPAGARNDPADGNGFEVWPHLRNTPENRLKEAGPAITQPTGYFAEVITAEALQRAHSEVPDEQGNKDREHVTRWLYTHQDAYRCHWEPVPAWYLSCQVPFTAVDSEGSYRRARRLMECHNYASEK